MFYRKLKHCAEEVSELFLDRVPTCIVDDKGLKDSWNASRSPAKEEIVQYVSVHYGQGLKTPRILYILIDDDFESKGSG